MKPSIIRSKALAMQLCVPHHWSNDDIIAFAQSEICCGTTNGWQVAKKGDGALRGDEPTVTCARNPDFKHVVVVA